MNANKKLVATSFNDLEKYAKGSLVELPPFGEGQPFVAYLKRPSMINMIRSGVIPNDLLASANKLFNDPSDISTVSDRLTDAMKYYDVIDVIVKEALVSPSYDEIEEAGLVLADDQVLAIFQYTQQGVQALDSFRTEQTDN